MAYNSTAVKQDDQKEPEKPKAEATPTFLDERELFTGKPLPYKEVEYIGPDGVKGLVWIQALGMKAMDEINHVQGQPVLDAHGKVLEEATRVGFLCKVVARALRKPNKMPMGGDHWLSLSEKIESQWLGGAVRDVGAAVLDLSGYTAAGREEEKKDS